jgi:hypothetical protein
LEGERVARDMVNKSFFSSSDEASPDVKVECLACLIQLAKHLLFRESCSVGGP